MFQQLVQMSNVSECSDAYYVKYGLRRNPPDGASFAAQFFDRVHVSSDIITKIVFSFSYTR